MSADFVSAAPSLAKDARPEHQRKMSHKNLDVRRPLLEKKAEVCKHFPLIGQYWSCDLNTVL